MKSSPEFVPENFEGKPLDIEHSITAADLHEAINTYKRTCARLQNPGVWQQLAGSVGAGFELFSNTNKPAKRLMKKGDFLRIDIPGPGSAVGGGYDWVEVESFEESVAPDAEESFGITLRSSKNPAKPLDGTAHFFKEDASSSFIIKRNGLTVTACYYGRNELPNTNTSSMVDKLRNSLVATGAIAGLSNLQWHALTKGLLAAEIGD